MVLGLHHLSRNLSQASGLYRVVIPSKQISMRFYPSQLFAISSLLWTCPINATPVSGRDAPTPGLPYDANTTEFCSWWADLTTVMACPAFLSENFISLEDFLRWVCANSPALNVESEQTNKMYRILPLQQTAVTSLPESRTAWRLSMSPLQHPVQRHQ